MKTKALISFAATAKCWFSHSAAHIRKSQWDVKSRSSIYIYTCLCVGVYLYMNRILPV